MTDEAFVYIIAKRLDDGWAAPCKIGLARNPVRRMASIGTSVPFPIDLYATLGPMPRGAASSVEKAFHAVKGSNRLHGEWFHIDPDVALSMLVVAMTAALVVHAAADAQQAGECARDHVWCVDTEVHQGYVVQ